MVSKLAVNKSEKKLSEMSIEELQNLSQNHFTEEKKVIIAKF